MSELEDDALKIARYMYDNKIFGSKSITVAELKSGVGLSEEDFDVADDFLLETGYCAGTGGGDAGTRVLKAQGVRFVSARSDDAGTRVVGEQNDGRAPLEVFVSHSSADAKIAEALIALLHTALNIPAERIRCTSVEGYRLEAGASVNDQLRREIHEARSFIGLITRTSLQSTYVLFELGARWGAGRHLIPLLVSGADSDLLRDPLKSLNALRCDVPAQVHQLVTNIASVLGVSSASAAAYQKHVDALVRKSKRRKGSKPGRGEEVKPAVVAASERASSGVSPTKDDYLDSLVRAIDGDVSFQDRRAEWRSTEDGVASALTEVEKLYQELERLVRSSNEKSASVKVSLRRLATDRLILSGRGLNLLITWNCPSAGSLDGSVLTVTGVEGDSEAEIEESLREEHGFYHASYEIDLKEDLSVFWRRIGVNRLRTTEELAFDYLSFLLSAIRNKGDKK